MSRPGVCASVAASLALILGSCCWPVFAQEGDENPPPPPPRRPRAKAQLAPPIQRATAVEPEPEGQPEQGAEQPAPKARLPRPQIPPMQLSAIDAETQEVVKAWERNSAGITTLKGNIKRITYNSVFRTVRVEEGSFWYKAPDAGAFFIEGIVPKAGAPAVPVRGVPFKLQPGVSEHWICTGAHLVSIDHAKKEYRVVVIPPESRGPAIMDTPLPFLLGMKEKQARMRYELQLLANNGQNDFRIEVKPRLAKDRANYKKAEVLLDSQTYLPNAVKMVDSGGNEIVFVFKKTESNVPLTDGSILGRKNPLDPKEYIGKMRRVQDADRAESARGGPTQPTEGGEPLQR